MFTARRLVRLVLGVLLTLVHTAQASAALPVHTEQIDLIPGPDGSAYAVAFDPGTNKIYSTDLGVSVPIIDPSARLVVDRIGLGSQFSTARAVAVHPTTHKVFVTGDGNQLAIVDPTARSVSTFPLPSSSHYGLALDAGLN